MVPTLPQQGHRPFPSHIRYWAGRYRRTGWEEIKTAVLFKALRLAAS